MCLHVSIAHSWPGDTDIKHDPCVKHEREGAGPKGGQGLPEDVVTPPGGACRLQGPTQHSEDSEDPGGFWHGPALLSTCTS